MMRPLKISRVVLLTMAAAALFAAPAGAADPTVSNVRAQQLPDKTVEVLYDLSGAPAGGATVSVKFSEDGGASYTIVPAASALSGHVGAGITNGTNRRIIWNAAATMPAEFYKTTMRAAVTAVDLGTGSLAFRLAWNGTNDLDLYVKEPNGTIIYFNNKGPTSTGGRLDVDCNADCDAASMCSSPVENVFWPTGGAPSGTYEFWVRWYKTCSGPTPTNFTLTVYVNGAVAQTYSGSLNGTDSQRYTFTFGGGGGGGAEITVTLPGNVPLVLVRIPAGTFMMGSPVGERGRDSDETQHQVTLTQDYYLGKYEVTQRQWVAVMGSNPSHFSSCGLDCPVERVSWNDICGGTTGSTCTSTSFIGKLNAHLAATGQPGAGKFRLPTEAEWERAARGGTTGPFSFDTSANPSWDMGCGSFPQAEGYMWWCNNSGYTTRPVGQKLPNPYGLYDMHGNVWEWVADWYGSYPTGAVADPPGPSMGSARVLRGGGFYDNARYCRSALRYDYFPGYRYNFIGFRLARSL